LQRLCRDPKKQGFASGNFLAHIELRIDVRRQAAALEQPDVAEKQRPVGADVA